MFSPESCFQYKILNSSLKDADSRSLNKLEILVDEKKMNQLNLKNIY